jgi:hypothetical protein
MSAGPAIGIAQEALNAATAGSTQITTDVIPRLQTAETRISDVQGTAAGTAINENSRFNDYPTAVGLPTNWSDGWTGSSQDFTRVPNENGGYALRIEGRAGVQAYTCQYGPTGRFRTGQWVMVEVDWTLDAGTTSGAGVLVRFRNASRTLTVQEVRIGFPTETDASGVLIGAGTVGQTYRIRKLIQITAADADRLDFFPMAHWSSNGSVAAANAIIFHNVAIRAATPAEIATPQIAPLATSVAAIQGELPALLPLDMFAADTVSWTQATNANKSPPDFLAANVMKNAAGETYLNLPGNGSYCGWKRLVAVRPGRTYRFTIDVEPISTATQVTIYPRFLNADGDVIDVISSSSPNVAARTTITWEQTYSTTQLADKVWMRPMLKSNNAAGARLYSMSVQDVTDANFLALTATRLDDVGKRFDASYSERSILEFYTTPTMTDAQAFAAAVALNTTQPIFLYFPGGKGKGIDGTYDIGTPPTVNSEFPFGIRGDNKEVSVIRLSGTKGIQVKPSIWTSHIGPNNDGLVNRWSVQIENIGFRVAATLLEYALWINIPYLESSPSIHGYLRDIAVEPENYMKATDATRVNKPGAYTGECSMLYGMKFSNIWAFEIADVTIDNRTQYGYDDPAVGDSGFFFEGICIQTRVKKSAATAFPTGFKYRTKKLVAFQGTYTSGTFAGTKGVAGTRIIRGCNFVQTSTGATGRGVVVRPDFAPYYANSPVCVDEVTGTFAPGPVSIRDGKTGVQVGTFNITAITRVDKPCEAMSFQECDPLCYNGWDIDCSADADGVTYNESYGLEASWLNCHCPALGSVLRIRGMQGISFNGGYFQAATPATQNTFTAIDLAYVNAVAITNATFDCQIDPASPGYDPRGAFAGIKVDTCSGLMTTGNIIRGFRNAYYLTNMVAFACGPDSLHGRVDADLVHYEGSLNVNCRFVSLNDISGPYGRSISSVRNNYIAQDFGKTMLDIQSTIGSTAIHQGSNVDPIARIRVNHPSTLGIAGSVQVFSVEASNGSEKLFQVLGDGVTKGIRGAFVNPTSLNVLNVENSLSTTLSQAPLTIRVPNRPSSTQEQFFSCTNQTNTVMYILMDGTVVSPRFMDGPGRELKFNDALPETNYPAVGGSIVSALDTNSLHGRSLWLKLTGDKNDSTNWARIALAGRYSQLVIPQASFTLSLANLGFLTTAAFPTPMNITVPPSNATATNIPITSEYTFIQMGETITFVPGAGVTIYSLGNKFRTLGFGARAVLTKVNATSWVLSGDLQV